jgi:antitoxin ParD1/3/4
MGANVHLTPELERFTHELVAEGRYNNVSEVVRSALRLLQEAEERRRRFTASLLEAEAEADRNGYVTLDDMWSKTEEIIKAAES